MDLFAKTKQLEEVKNRVNEIEKVLTCSILALGVDKLYFSDNSDTPVVYVILHKADDAKSNLKHELELTKGFPGIVFDIVSQEHYSKNLSPFAQLFFEV